MKFTWISGHYNGVCVFWLIEVLEYPVLAKNEMLFPCWKIIKHVRLVFRQPEMKMKLENL